MSTDIQESAIPTSSKDCVACRKLIHAEAQLCRYCGAGHHPRFMGLRIFQLSYGNFGVIGCYIRA